jgi:uncharacterized membrane protein
MDKKKLGTLYIFITALLFSTGGLFIKLLTWSPLAINAARSAVSVLVIGTYLKLEKVPLKVNKYVLLGAVCMSATNNLYVVANKLTTAANTILLQFTAPVFILLFMWLFYKEKPKKADVITSIAVFTGILFFFMDSLQTGNMLGNVLALASGATYAVVFMLNTFPNAMRSVEKNTIFTNVALTDDGDVWWEGIGTEAPDHLIDWKGNDWTPDSKEKAAHPNARFTAPARQCPSIAPEWEDPKGVPISAFLVGGRRKTTIPLVHESFDWNHGVFMGSIMGSEITAAAISDKIGQVRRDPFAMLPFAGYHMCDYLQHWIDMGKKSDKLPKLFYVNWFRRDEQGNFMWPGFGENSRVLKWIFEEVTGTGKHVDTPIGRMPTEDAIDTEGLNVSKETMDKLLAVNKEEWLQEVESIKQYYAQFGDKMPKELRDQLEALEQRLKNA